MYLGASFSRFIPVTTRSAATFIPETKQHADEQRIHSISLRRYNDLAKQGLSYDQIGLIRTRERSTAPLMLQDYNARRRVYGF